jgi:hypothetical protein
MSASRVADVLDRVDADTLKAALKRMDVNKVKDVVAKLDKEVAKTAKAYLKKLDPSKYKDVVSSVVKKADPRNWF